MTDEKLLKEKLDKLVMDGYGDVLVYACKDVADVAIKGYTKGIIAGAVISILATELVKSIMKR